MPTRQTSSSGRPKSPRIQVVLPEELCDRLAVLAELEARTVSNMARVLIQQGVERLETLHGLEPDEASAAAPAELPRPVRPAPEGLSRRDRSRGASPEAKPSRAKRPRGDEAKADRARENSADDGRFGAASPIGRRAAPSRRAPSVGSPSRGTTSDASPFSADAFRAELERQGQEPSPRAQRPRRLRIWRPS